MKVWEFIPHLPIIIDKFPTLMQIKCSFFYFIKQNMGDYNGLGGGVAMLRIRKLFWNGCQSFSMDAYHIESLNGGELWVGILPHFTYI